MAALDYDLHIDQGSEYRLRVPVLDQDGDAVNLTGWSLRGEIRATHSSPYVLYDLGDSLAVDDDDVHVLLTILASDSAPWVWTSAVYDIEIVDPGGSVYRLLQGRVFVSPGVTR